MSRLPLAQIAPESFNQGLAWIDSECATDLLIQSILIGMLLALITRVGQLDAQPLDLRKLAALDLINRLTPKLGKMKRSRRCADDQCLDLPIAMANQLTNML